MDVVPEYGKGLYRQAGAAQRAAGAYGNLRFALGNFDILSSTTRYITAPCSLGTLSVTVKCMPVLFSTSSLNTCSGLLSDTVLESPTHTIAFERSRDWEKPEYRTNNKKKREVRILNFIIITLMLELIAGAFQFFALRVLQAGVNTPLRKIKMRP